MQINIKSIALLLMHQLFIVSWMILTLPLLSTDTAQAEDFQKLDEAISSSFVAEIAPVFDFDKDGCLPSAGISRRGKKNRGLKINGTITGECRSPNFLDTSNTLHRSACVKEGRNIYCAHIYALYFEKDQIFPKNGGHCHDWEYAVVWTKNGRITHGSVSMHGWMTTRPVSKILFDKAHMKVVYHKDGNRGGTHAMRFATNKDQKAENPYRKFVTPTIISWNVLHGDWLSNETMTAKLNSFDFGKAVVPCKDYYFFNKLNKFKPPGYPNFAPDIQTGREGGVCYRVHVQGRGWMPEVCDGEMAGTTHEKRRIEAIQIWSHQAKICYKVYIQEIGWIPEVCDGEMAGSTAKGLRLEAIKIFCPSNRKNIQYQAHVQDSGWQPETQNGNMAGTIGKKKRMEAIRVWLK